MLFLEASLFLLGVAVLGVGLLFWRTRPLGSDSKQLSEEEAEKIVRQGFTASRVPAGLDVIVIGSGMGGLTTGVMLARNNMKVLLLEQHDVLGGCTHTYTEKGYKFDTGLHYVGGDISNPRSMTRKIMNLVTDAQVEWADMHGVAPFFYDVVADFTGFEFGFRARKQQMLDMIEQFPSQEKGIRQYYQLVRSGERALNVLMGLKLMPLWLNSFLSCLPIVRKARKMMCQSTLEVVSSLTSNKQLQAVFCYAFGDLGLPPSQLPWPMYAILARHYYSGGSYPVGGPDRIAQAAVQVIEKYGGKALVRAPVAQIIIESGRAVGVRMARNNAEIRAPIIISACNVFNTYKRLIAEVDRAPLATCIAAMERALKPSVTHLTLFAGFKGSSHDLKLPAFNTWFCKHLEFERLCNDFYKLQREDLEKDGIAYAFISFPSAKDPESRHQDRSTCHVITESNYEWFAKWEETKHKNRGVEYDAFKEKLSQQLLQLLYMRFPHLKDKLEYCELGTPLSNNFYLNSYHGASYGLAHSSERFLQDWLRYDTPIPGLYLTGQDPCSCGIMGAAMGGFMCTAVVSKMAFLRNILALFKS